ncbi:hypothetical protein AK812_SmicGene20265 [Symbiodinium microadriaticum]|uniref:NAD(P)-binding domain-containing protein n=1 Tax=Symbiodinium microadriaticum TaxID=2951 RepID=A0A1Q9DQF2_SYMMI|nr:hypothetical protein AK812_SmicGene20265 [Symbiodinium microadriaticum]
MAHPTLLLALAAFAVRCAADMVAVTGATGKLGRHAVQQLVEQGYSVRCLCRSAPTKPSRGEDATAGEVAAWLATLPGVEVFQGQVTEKEKVMELLRGCSACLALHGAKRYTEPEDLLPWVDESTDANHGKQVNCEAVGYLLDAAVANGSMSKRTSTCCKRLVRVTGKGEDPWSPFSILINGLGSMAKAWNQEGERRLRGQSQVDYTIIRPGYMGKVDATLDDEVSLALADDGGDLKVSAIPHRCVAELCVRCLAYPNAARATLVAMTQPGDGPRPRRAMQGPLLLVVLFAFCNVAGAEDAASCEGDDPALLQSKQTRSLGNLSLQNVQLHSLPIPPTTCAHCCWQDGEEVPCLDVEGCAARGPQKGKYAIVLSLVGAAVQSANETRFRYFASMRAAAKLAGADILLLVDKRNSATLSPFVLKLVQDKELKLLLVDWEVPPQMTWTNSKVPWCGRQDFIRLHVLGLQGYDAAAYYDTDVEFRGDITPMLKCAATGKFLSSSGGIGEPLNVGFFALRPDNRLLSAALALAEIGFDKQTSELRIPGGGI